MRLTNFKDVFRGVAIAGGSVGIAAVSLLFSAHMQASELPAYAIDHGASAKFTSIGQCMAARIQKQDCVTALNTALRVVDAPGTGVSYFDAETCGLKHGFCSATKIDTPYYTPVGREQVLTGYTSVTAYSPPVVGWQMLRDNPAKALPLYADRASGGLVRADGKKFALTPIG